MFGPRLYANALIDKLMPVQRLESRIPVLFNFQRLLLGEITLNIDTTCIKRQEPSEKVNWAKEGF